MSKPHQPHLQARANQLRNLLNKAKSNPQLQHDLIHSPDTALQREGLPKHWAPFFRGLKPGDFESHVKTQADLMDGEGEGEGEG